MANGIYGTRKPALITSDDIDIFYNYRPTRSSSDATNFIQIDSTILSPTKAEDGMGNLLGELPGAYNLRLPLDKFSKKGIYNIYIRPKEIKTTILDVSTLSAYPDIRGIVLNIESLSAIPNVTANGSLIGYRIEYLDEYGRREGTVRIITSNNRCEPLAQNLNNALQKNLTYRFNDSSNLFFCTLTPSTSQSFNTSNLPYIGATNQTIKICNTKFNPLMIEVELIDNDFDTITTLISGDQIRDLSAGIITTFNEDGGIVQQVKTGTHVDISKKLHVDFKIKNNDIINQTTEYQEVKENLE